MSDFFASFFSPILIACKPKPSLCLPFSQLLVQRNFPCKDRVRIEQSWMKKNRMEKEMKKMSSHEILDDFKCGMTLPVINN